VSQGQHVLPEIFDLLLKMQEGGKDQIVVDDGTKPPAATA